MISTSKQCVEHPFAGRNTQQSMSTIMFYTYLNVTPDANLISVLDVARLPLEINSWLMPIKYSKEQLFHNWIDNGKYYLLSTCKGILLKVQYICTIMCPVGI